MSSNNKIDFQKLYGILSNEEKPTYKTEAFEYLKNSSKNLIFKLVRQKGGSIQEAEDILNDTVEDVFQKIIQNEYDPQQSNLVTFIWGIANNKWLYLKRSEKNRSKHEKGFLESNSKTARIFAMLQDDELFEEQIQHMMEALQQLDEPCLSILKDYYFKGNKLKDMAKEYGIQEDAMKKRKSRCLKKLKIYFKDLRK